MTVAAEIPLALYDGDGTTTAFPAPWRYLATANLLVELLDAAGVATLRTLGTDYSATAGATDAGGTVTMVTAPAVGQTLRVRRVTPMAQTTQYPTSGSFPARSHELALDRQMMAVQEQGRELDDVQGRALQVPYGESTSSLPSAAARANRLLGFGSFGALAVGLLTSEVQLAIENAKANLENKSLADQVMFFQAGLDPEPRTAQSKMRDFINVLDFGADPTGVASSDDAISKAEAYAASFAAMTGSVNTPMLWFPPGVYLVGPQTKVSFIWQGAGANNTHLLYDGPAGDDWLTQSVTDAANSAGGIRDMSLDGVDCGVIFTMPRNAAGYGWDDRYVLEHVRFYRGAIQIYVDAWVNVYWRNLRFDNMSDCAILLKAKTGQNQSSFNLQDFTTDNASGGSTAQANCFLRLDMSDVSSSGNIGIIRLGSSRLETNNVALLNAKSFFDIISTGARQVEWRLDSLTIQNSRAGGVDALFNRSQGGVLTAERFNIDSLQMNGVTAMFKGDYPAWMIAIPVGNYLWFTGEVINGFSTMRTVSSGATGEQHFAPARNSVVYAVRQPSLPYDNLQVRGDVLLGGSGSVAPGVLFRLLGKTGWPPPAGTLVRADPAYTAPAISAAPTQAEVQAIANQLQTTTRILAALINDHHRLGSSSPNGTITT